MKPYDPRLNRYAAAARAYLVATVGLGVLTAVLVLLQAGLLAHVLAHANRGAGALKTSLLAVGVVLLARAAAAYGGEVAALRAAATVKSQLRQRLAARLVDMGPERSSGEVATLMTRGLDALDPYFARYLPQLVLACLVPLAVLARVAGADLISAITIGVTLPLIPIFMVLIGLQARARTERQWTLLSTLGGHFLDVVEGLPTLKVFGRAKAQIETIRCITDEHRRATMATLRVAFVSAFVLELLATLATALVAVEVGLRLLAGNLSYETALLVLLLAPEAFLPLRAVGAQFHASLEGVTAAQQALDMIDAPSSGTATGRRVTSGAAVDLRRADVRLERVSLTHPDRAVPALRDASLVVHPGERIAVVGPTGAGKSSLLSLLLRFHEPSSGRITAGGVDLRDVDLAAWRQQIAWMPQRAHLFAGTVADNIRLAAASATDEAVRRAARAAGVLDFTALDTVVAERGLTFSSGQRQRVALARAFLRDAPVLLLDEPTAHLDEPTADDMRAAVRRLAEGRTVIVVSHVHGWTADADRVITLHDGQLSEDMKVLAS
jgi:ATP-binding cassette subfamily C protein CydD